MSLWHKTTKYVFARESEMNSHTMLFSDGLGAGAIRKEADYGGCRSWVNLPDLPAEISTHLVLDDAVHRERERQVRAVIGA